MSPALELHLLSQVVQEIICLSKIRCNHIFFNIYH